MRVTDGFSHNSHAGRVPCILSLFIQQTTITRKQCAKWVTIPHAQPSRSSHDNGDSVLGVIDSNW